MANQYYNYGLKDSFYRDADYPQGITAQPIPNVPNGTITSVDLLSNPSLDFQTTQDTPTYPVAGLNSELTLTQPEKKADDLSTQLQQLNEELVGQSTFRAEQEKSQGIEGLTQVQSDLSARLKGLQNEALAIPLQLQQESEGRGITGGGLRPIQTASLRNNAIQALSTASLLEASRGNLTTALNLVDRAVSQKFDPIKEEIAVKQANLDLILKSPSYSLAEKNRATQQQIQQEIFKRKLDQQQENNKISQAMANAAVTLNPGNKQALFAAQQALALDPTESGYLQKVFGLLGQFQSDPAQAQKDLDAHLRSQVEIQSTLDATQLAREKFEEDRMRFGLEYALRKAATNIEESGASPYQVERAARTIESIDDLMKDVNINNVGIGGLRAILPMTSARNFKAQIETLKANIAFSELTAMREASKTGGALGQVSDREGKLLESSLGALDTLQSPGAFKDQLSKIKSSLIRWQTALGQYQGESLRSQVKNLGYDYDAMINDNLTDEQIKEQLGL